MPVIQDEMGARLACELCGIPEHMVDGVVRYVVHRVEPGDFMTALLSNDLMGAAHRADDLNGPALFNWAKLLYNHFPIQSYGSPEAVAAWTEKGGADAG